MPNGCDHPAQGNPIAPQPWLYTRRFIEAVQAALLNAREPAAEGDHDPVREPPARDLLDRARLRGERGRGDRGAPPRRDRGCPLRARRPGGRRGVRAGGPPHRRGLLGRRHTPEAPVAGAQEGVPRAPRRRGPLGPPSCPRPTSSTTPARSSRTCGATATWSGSASTCRRPTASGTTAPWWTHSAPTRSTRWTSSTNSTARSARWKCLRVSAGDVSDQVGA